MHKLLDRIPEQEMISELEESKKILLEHSVVNQKPLSFCYPNGNYNQNIVENIEQAGYRLAFTTKHNWQNFDYEPYELSRIAIHNDITFSKALFASRIAGII
jgi:peptidoglycan/xylan/chitin deacetylase (PgdA/CDA1 family)